MLQELIEDSLYRFQRKKGMDLLAQILNQGRDWPHLGNHTLVQLIYILDRHMYINALIV